MAEKCKYFGTDGIRDAVTGPRMAPTFVRKFARGLIKNLNEKNAGTVTIAIGRDTRASGVNIEKALCEGLSEGDVRIVSLGVLPTPAVAMALADLNANMGIMITASHNPASDNGIKLLNEKGWKLPIEEELEIESCIDASTDSDDVSEFASENYDGISPYKNRCSQILPESSLSGWKIVLDTANGAACDTSPDVLSHYGAELTVIGNNPDGENINDGFGTECPDNLADHVKKTGAVIGIAHDGDADRLLVCDENGSILQGEELMGILALNEISNGSKEPIVTTIQSNKGFDLAIENAGGKVERVDVGDRNVLYKMLETGSKIGGESSGHILCMEYLPISDGLITAIMLLKVMLETGKPLSELRESITLFPKVSNNLKVKEKKPIDSLSELNAAIAGIYERLEGKGQVIVRYSGTESKIRLLVEGQDQGLIDGCMADLIKAVEKELDVIA